MRNICLRLFDYLNQHIKMLFCRKGISQLLFFCIIEFLILFFLFINSIFHSISMYIIFKVFFFQLGIFYLLGNIVVRALRININSIVEDIGLSYAVGGSMSIILYFVFMSLNMRDFLPVATVVIVILLAAEFLMNNNYCDYKLCNKDEIILLLILVIVLLCNTLTISLVNSFASETGVNGYHQDWLFWAGNNISFVKKYPAYNFRQVGIPFKYHYFSSILCAQMSLSTLTDINIISFYFSYIFAGVLMVFGAHCVSKELITERLFFILSIVGILFSDGTMSELTWHTSICPFGFDYGFAYCLFALYILIRMIKEEKINDYMVLSCILLAMTTGCKGPIGLLVIIGYLFLSVYLIVKREYKNGLLSGVIWGASFSLVMILFILNLKNWIPELYNKNQPSSNMIASRPLELASLHDIFEDNHFINIVYYGYKNALRVINDRLLLKIYSVWTYIFRSNKFAITLLVISIVVIMMKQVKLNKKEKCIVNAMQLMSLIGITLSIVTIQNGNSQIYFMLAVFPFCILSGLFILEKCKTMDVNWTVYLLATVLCLLGMSIIPYTEKVGNYSIQGITSIRHRFTEEDFNYYSVDSTDEDMYEWIKNNTPEDSILAIDKLWEEDKMHLLLTAGVFSERYIWNEIKYSPKDESDRRNEIVAELESHPTEAAEKLKEEGVNYLLCMKSRKNDSILEEHYKMIYENSKYVFYSIEGG